MCLRSGCVFLCDTFFIIISILVIINLFLPNALLLYPPEKTRKPCGFLMFSRGRERVHWDGMG